MIKFVWVLVSPWHQTAPTMPLVALPWILPSLNLQTMARQWQSTVVWMSMAQSKKMTRTRQKFVVSFVWQRLREAPSQSRWRWKGLGAAAADQRRGRAADSSSASNRLIVDKRKEFNEDMQREYDIRELRCRNKTAEIKWSSNALYLERSWLNMVCQTTSPVDPFVPQTISKPWKCCSCQRAAG